MGWVTSWAGKLRGYPPRAGWGRGLVGRAAVRPSARQRAAGCRPMAAPVGHGCQRHVCRGGPGRSQHPQVPGAYLIVLVPELWSALSNVCHVQRQNGKCQSPRPLVMLTEMVFRAYCVDSLAIPPSRLVVFNCCLYTLVYDSNLQERDQFWSEPTFIILFATK